MTQGTDKPTFEEWAVVEIFGHDRYAGRVTEQTIGGCHFVRVDVPQTENAGAFTKLFGQGAIFSITPVTEEKARSAAERFRSTPCLVYGVTQPRQPRLGFSDEHEDFVGDLSDE